HRGSRAQGVAAARLISQPSCSIQPASLTDEVRLPGGDDGRALSGPPGLLFDSVALRQPVSTPDQVRGRALRESTMAGDAQTCALRSRPIRLMVSGDLPRKNGREATAAMRWMSW